MTLGKIDLRLVFRRIKRGQKKRKGGSLVFSSTTFVLSTVPLGNRRRSRSLSQLKGPGPPSPHLEIPPFPSNDTWINYTFWWMRHDLLVTYLRLFRYELVDCTWNVCSTRQVPTSTTESFFNTLTCHLLCSPVWCSPICDKNITNHLYFLYLASSPH